MATALASRLRRGAPAMFRGAGWGPGPWTGRCAASEASPAGPAPRAMPSFACEGRARPHHLLRTRCRRPRPPLKHRTRQSPPPSPADGTVRGRPPSSCARCEQWRSVARRGSACPLRCLRLCPRHVPDPRRRSCAGATRGGRSSFPPRASTQSARACGRLWTRAEPSSERRVSPRWLTVAMAQGP